MDLSDYQKQAKSTAIYPEQYLVMYPALGLAGEVGECLNKIKKIYRDSMGFFTDDTRTTIGDEIGDVLWYLSNLASDLDLDLSEIAIRNIQKLIARAERGTLQGSGDNR